MVYKILEDSVSLLGAASLGHLITWATKQLLIKHIGVKRTSQVLPNKKPVFTFMNWTDVGM